MSNSKVRKWISRSVLYTIVSEKLNYQKLCSRWVPRLLSDDHKTKSLGSALSFLTRYDQEGDELLDHIVTGDETYVSHMTPESKQQSMEWRHTSSPTKVKAKQTISVRKIMATVFWDRKGILLVDFMPRGTTINSDTYCVTLRKLRRAIQNKRRGLLSSGVMLLHDNARPHSAQTQGLISSFGWEQLDHPPYSPDLAPSDFHLFRYLKEFLGGQQFNDDEEVKTAVMDWASQAADFFKVGIQKIVERYAERESLQTLRELINTLESLGAGVRYPSDDTIHGESRFEGTVHKIIRTMVLI
ncbi:histone-lysine N-methyltransferase SETMAR-like [Centruroides vittatus]|uniref:histone-lysine N-methyltransferase SETMAR-like n=1 Tax=Centruroides vittatus TaxID=120091 RepID=UPI00350FCCA4